jgi:hypothetical protein
LYLFFREDWLRADIRAGQFAEICFLLIVRLRKRDKTRAKSPSAGKMPEGLWERLDAIRMLYVNTKSM